ncbi:MAG TPA: Arm DNA-binding domain-containing protein, partial [Steroidobacteraceae bacterium]|nr:Arm DNA-binding domain-containing protein [Steroidobacteraceae bacterium]
MPEKLTKEAVERLKALAKPYDTRDTEIRGFLVRTQPSGAKAFYFDYRLEGWPGSKRARYRLGSFPRLSAEG